MLFSIGPCQTVQQVCFTRQRIVSTGCLPNSRMHTFFVGGPRLCTFEVKTWIFSIHYFHFSCANVNVAGSIVESSLFIKQCKMEESEPEE